MERLEKKWHKKSSSQDNCLHFSFSFFLSAAFNDYDSELRCEITHRFKEKTKQLQFRLGRFLCLQLKYLVEVLVLFDS